MASTRSNAIADVRGRAETGEAEAEAAASGVVAEDAAMAAVAAVEAVRATEEVAGMRSLNQPSPPSPGMTRFPGH